MRLSPKQLVTVVVALSAAAVLTPITVSAATGQLVNIADAVTAGRLARVSQAGALQVENRAGVPAGALAVQGSRLGVGWVSLVNVALPQQLAITEMSITAQGPTGVQSYRIEAWVRKGSTGSCNAPNLTEFNRHVLRQVTMDNYETLTLSFAGTPLYVPAAPKSGTYTCFGVVSISAPNGSETYAGATGYRFTP